MIRSLLQIDRRVMMQRCERPRKARRKANTECICRERGAAGTLRRPSGAVRFYAQQAPRQAFSRRFYCESGSSQICCVIEPFCSSTYCRGTLASRSRTHSLELQGSSTSRDRGDEKARLDPAQAGEHILTHRGCR